MMSLPSALLGYAAFRAAQGHLIDPFTAAENVYVQSLAVAVGTGPLTFGFVGVIPAIEKFLPTSDSASLGLYLSTIKLMVWSGGIAFFGVFFAVLLRKQIIVREKLRFPSGSATAILISVLHRIELRLDQKQKPENEDTELDDDTRPNDSASVYSHDNRYYTKNIHTLLISFALSSLYTVCAYFVPIIRDLPIFGNYLAKDYLWTFQPSPAYVGQGIIMGLPTVTSMLFGALLGWAVLAPLAQNRGWATGPIDDWKTGGQGWILWISLVIMVADAVVTFSVVSVQALYRSYNNARHSYSPLSPSANDHATDGGDGDDDNSLLEDVSPEYSADAPKHELVNMRVALIGLGASVILCVLATRYAFGPIIPVYATLCATVLALFLSVLGVRALGETDLNPVSGIGKLSQLIFALIIPRDHPGAILINLVAGGITEAGAQQAGDLMQDLKTGHMVMASPKAQFIAQMIGSVWSVFLSALVYRLYDAVYDIPGSLFRIPTAVIWIDCAKLVTGDGLPDHVDTFAIVFGIIFAIVAAVKALFADRKWTVYLPSGVAVGIGLYNTPSFTLARFVGGCIAAYWARGHKDYDSQVLIIILSSGLVLGEGVTSILSLVMTSLGVPHF